MGRENDVFALGAEVHGRGVLAFGAGAGFTFDAGGEGGHPQTPDRGTLTSTLNALPLVPALALVVLGTQGRIGVAHDAGLVLWDLGRGRLVSVLEKGGMAHEEGFAFFGSPDGRSVGFLASPHGVYSGPDWGRILMWDGETGRPRGRMHADAFARPPEWIDGGARFVWEDSFGAPSVFDARTLQKLRSLPAPHEPGVPWVARPPRKVPIAVEEEGFAVWSPDGRTFALASTNRERTGELVLRAVRTGDPVRSLAVPAGAGARSLAFAPAGASIAAVVASPSSGRGALVVWSVATGAVTARVDLALTPFEDPGVLWFGPGVCAAQRDAVGELLLVRLSEGEVVRVQLAAAGNRFGYLASTRRGVFDLRGLPPEAVRFRDGRDVAHAPLLTADQVQRLARPGLVGDLLAGRSVAP